MKLEKIVSLLKSDIESDNLLGYYLVTHNNKNIRLVNEILEYYGVKLELDCSNRWINIGKMHVTIPFRGYHWKRIDLPEEHRNNIVIP